MDTYFLHVIRRTVGQSRVLDSFLIHFAERGPRWLLLVLGIAALFGRTETRVAVLTSLAAATLMRGLNELIGRIWHRDRPFVQEGWQPLIHHHPSSSFPSNHAACAFALAVPVWVHLPVLGALLLFMAAVLAFSRVFVGVHYPLDVTFGAAAGSLVAWLTDNLIS